jgi:hypothetical protein
MLSDQDLHAVYDSGAQTTHMTGLKAVWARALAWERNRVVELEAIPTTPLPIIDPSGIPGDLSKPPKPSGWV